MIYGYITANLVHNFPSIVLNEVPLSHAQITGSGYEAVVKLLLESITCCLARELTKDTENDYGLTALYKTTGGAKSLNGFNTVVNCMPPLATSRTPADHN